jgi:hypothetical protein
MVDVLDNLRDDSMVYQWDLYEAEMMDVKKAEKMDTYMESLMADMMDLHLAA